MPTIGSDGVLGGVQIELDEGGRDKAARLSDVVMDLGLAGTARPYSGTDICDTFYQRWILKVVRRIQAAVLEWNEDFEN